MKIGYLFGLLSGIFWAISAILYEYLNIHYSQISSLSIMFSLLFIIEISILVFYGLSLFRVNNFSFLKFYNFSSFFGILSGVIGGPLGMLCYLQAISYISTGYVGPISSIYPLFGCLFSFYFLGDRIGRLGIVGLALSLFCVFCLSIDLTDTKASVIGFLLSIGCAICWGIEITISSYVMRYHLPSDAYFLRQFGSSMGYVILLLFLDLNPIESLMIFDDQNFFIMISAIAIFSALSYFLYYQSIYIINAIRAMIMNITYGFWIILLNSIFTGIFMGFSNFIFIIFGFLGVSLVIIDNGSKK